MQISRRQLLLGLGSTVGAVGAGLLKPAWAGAAEAQACDGASPVPATKPADTGPGKKFGTAGEVQFFPGNTIICHLPPASTTHTEVTNAWQQLQDLTGKANITWLPPTSYHVTIFEGVVDALRRPGNWPHGLPLDAPLEECHRYLADRLRQFDLGITLPLRFVIDDTPRQKIRTAIPLKCIDDAEARKLSDLRNRLSEATGIRQANHDNYEFHSTGGYYVKQFSNCEASTYQKNFQVMVSKLKKNLPVIELGKPEFTLFSDMSHFERQFYLSSRS